MPSECEKLALGVDGGGTKSDAVLIDETGAVLGWGRSGTGQAFWAGRHGAREAYAEAIREALGEYQPEKLWAAGTYEHIFESLGLSGLKAHFVPAGELTRGLATALQTYGLLVLSGTGSFVGGLTETDKHVTLDGLGPVLGDHGSGYQIGLTGMRAAVASSWSPERRTSLERLVPQMLGVGTPGDLFDLVYGKHIVRSRIASVARAVVRAVEEGDAIARRIILQAADDISDVLADVIRQLRLEESDCALVASGGIAQNCEIYWTRVCERALEIAPHLTPMRPKVRPCVGAALLALKAMGVSWTEELLSRIEETQQPYLAALEDRPADDIPGENGQGKISIEYTPHGPMLQGDIPED